MSENPKGLYAFLNHNTKHFYESYQHPKNPSEYAFVDYYVHENNFQPNAPWYFISLNQHGDEQDNWDSVLMYINQHIDELPNFVLVSKTSPTAFVRQTHKNRFKHNSNRSFVLDKYRDPETEAIKQIIQKRIAKHGPFKAGFMFHNDTWRKGDGWYMYRYKKEGIEIILSYEELRKQALANGINVYNGRDDQFDRLLGYKAKDGFIEAHDKKDGSLEQYFINLGTPVAYVFESPIKQIPPVKNNILIDLFFQNVVFPTIAKSSVNKT